MKRLLSKINRRISGRKHNQWLEEDREGEPSLFADRHDQQIRDTLDIVSIAAQWAVFIETGSIAHQLDENGRLISHVYTDGNHRKDFLSSVHVQDRVNFMSAVSDCSHSKSEQSCNVRLAEKPGEGLNEFVFHEMTFRSYDSATTNTGMSGVLVVGKRVESFLVEQETLVKQREELEQADIAKTKFLANMSHELRTPLNSIIGFSEVLRSGAMGELKPEKRDEYVGIINDSAQHLLSVLNDILNISKIEAGKYQIFTEPFELERLIESVIAMFNVTASGKNISLSVKLCEDLPEVTADSRAIKQILINLLSNAIKFTPNGGAVCISVARIGRRISVVVEDTGIGISASQIENLGKPFYQADSEYSRNYEGTGLGLSIVEGLVALHGGSVSVESEVGSGTRICVEFPINCSTACQVPADCDAKVIKLSPQKNQVDPISNLYEETA